VNPGRTAARLWRRSRRALAALLADRPKPIDMRALRPPLPRLGGQDRQTICAALASMSLDGGDPEATAHYAREDVERFIRTVDLVPDTTGRLLEIGATPWFASLLLRWYRPGLDPDFTNFFAATEGRASQHVRVRAPGGGEEEHRFEFANLNVEASPFPYEDGRFDVVLFCEVIEHLQLDPLHALREIWRVLKPGGTLILTTPNAARLVNAVRMIDGNGLYDPYSGHGPYGRHNREYTVSELKALGKFAGFELNRLFTSDVYDESVAPLTIAPGLAALLRHREGELGQYIFTRWRKSETPPSRGKPGWLYMSWPADETVDLPYPYR
jgi:SAM-dependent methyltransferase